MIVSVRGNMVTKIKSTHGTSNISLKPSSQLTPIKDMSAMPNLRHFTRRLKNIQANWTSIVERFFNIFIQNIARGCCNLFGRCNHVYRIAKIAPHSVGGRYWHVCIIAKIAHGSRKQGGRS